MSESTPDRTQMKNLFEALRRAARHDLRVGQLLENLRKRTDEDLFYVENDDLAKRINKYIDEIEKLERVQQ